MEFKVNSAVRLRADSQLLVIVSIDEQSAIAYCRRFSNDGLEGEPEPYPFDCLRENVIRAPRPIDQRADSTVLRRVICRIGLHTWQAKIFQSRPLIGDIEGKVCKHCGEIRLKK